MAEKVPRSPDQLWSRLQETAEEAETDFGEVKGLLRELQRHAQEGRLPSNVDVAEMFDGVSALTPELFGQFCANQLRTVEELQRSHGGTRRRTRRRK